MVSGVNDILGNNSRVSDLGNGQVAYGYALKGVEFTYLRVADIRTYTESENGQSHVEVLYGIPVNTTTDQMLGAIGVTHENRYAPADQTVGGALTYYYQSDTLIKGLEAALASNSTTVKNALENYVTANGGTAMPETDSYGKTSASGLPLGLYDLHHRAFLRIPAHDLCGRRQRHRWRQPLDLRCHHVPQEPHQHPHPGEDRP